MSNRDLNQILSPPEPAGPDPQILETEAKMWEQLLADIDNEQLHKNYVGFAIKNNLLKQASRRYGSIIDDKEKYSIESRRLMRIYQKSLVDILFFVPKKEEPPKSNSLQAFLVFFAVMLFFLGVSTFMTDVSKVSPAIILIMRSMIPVSFVFVVIFVWRRFQKARDFLDKSNQ